MKSENPEETHKDLIPAPNEKHAMVEISLIQNSCIQVDLLNNLTNSSDDYK